MEVGSELGFHPAGSDPRCTRWPAHQAGRLWGGHCPAVALVTAWVGSGEMRTQTD